MSPIGATARNSVASFPRVSGDEPLYTGDVILSEAFSPRERG